MKLYKRMVILLVLSLLLQASNAERRSGKKKGGKHLKPRKIIKTTIAPVVEGVDEDTDKHVVGHVIENIPDKIVEEEDAEWIPTATAAEQPTNLCPPELKLERRGTSPCVCYDNLDKQALMVECVALGSAHEMHTIFHSLLVGKRIDAIEVHNSTLGSTIPQMTGFSYIGSIWMRGNEITVINKRTFEGTEQAVRRLDLGANQLTSVDFSMFDTFTHLQVLNLGENQLSRIDNAGNAASLRVLHLQSNRIESIGPKAFYGLKALEYLDLRWNLLQVISSTGLEVSSGRWQLRLRSNQISSLEDAFGDNLPYLTELHGNNIDTLTDTVYGPLAEVALLEGSKIYLGENPIKCDCSIVWLVKNVTLASTIVGAKCDGDGIPILNFKVNDLTNCPPPKTWISPVSKIYIEENEK